jgi:hypothetical protein
MNTISGKLPAFPSKVKVFKTDKLPITLLNVDNARQKVAEVGFDNDAMKQYHELALSTTKYQWQVLTNDLFRTIIMDTNTYNFKLSTSYRTYEPLLTQSFTNDDTSAEKIAISFLQAMSLPIDDINQDKPKVQTLMLKDGVLVQADSGLTTQIMRVDLYQKDVDELPIYYPTYPFSPMYFLIMARAINTDDVVEANFPHQLVASESATYPIKTAQEAFNELEQGKAYITNYFGTSSSIQIIDVSLGYYIGESSQDYLMPVILFQSKNFYAIVPAIKDACLTTSTATLDDCQGKVVKK